MKALTNSLQFRYNDFEVHLSRSNRVYLRNPHQKKKLEHPVLVRRKKQIQVAYPKWGVVPSVVHEKVSSLLLGTAPALPESFFNVPVPPKRLNPFAERGIPYIKNWEDFDHAERLQKLGLRRMHHA